MAVQIQTVKKIAFLRQMRQRARSTQSALGETLLEAASGHFVNTFARGKLTISQSGSGQSGSYQVEMPGGEWTQSNVFGLIEELIQLLEFTCTNETLTDGDTDSERDALFNAMVSNLIAGNVPDIGTRELFGDFSNLRAV